MCAPAFLAAQQPQADPALQEQLEQGKRALKEGKNKEAITALKGVLDASGGERKRAPAMGEANP